MPKHTLPTATEGNEPDTVDNTAVKAVFDLWVGQSSTGGLHGQFTLYAASPTSSPAKG